MTIRFSGLAWILLVAALAAPAARAECEPADDDRVGDEILVELEAWGSVDVVAARHGVTVLDAIPRFSLYRIGVPPGANIDAIVGQLEGDPDVRDAEPHRRLETAEGVQRSIADLDINGTVGTFQSQSTTNLIHTAAAHQHFTGASVLVAVVDTNVAVNHVVLRGASFGPGFDMIGGAPTADVPPNGLDDDADGDVDEADQHGTHVAGLVHLAAPGARILAIRVLEEDGQGDVFTTAKGILQAIDAGADIINLSFGMVPSSLPLERAIEYALDAGIVVVAPAGNRNGGCPDFPANQPEVLAVAGIGADLVKTSFSSYGIPVGLSAPADALLSPYRGQSFARWSGTSFAAPLVSGGVALLLEKYPGLSPSEAIATLRASTQPDNNPPSLSGQMGTGVLDLDLVTRALTGNRSSVKVERGSSGGGEAAVVRFSPVEGAATYDLVRGSVANLRLAGGTVELGTLACLADGLAAPSSYSVSVPASAVPEVGEAYFYLFRDDGDDGGGGTYGTGGNGEPRIPDPDTDCPN